MSHDLSTLARRIILPGPIKVVLMVFASRGCKFCGLTWPGMALLKEECGLGETRLRGSLEFLVRDERGLLRIHAYPQGGRGRATEFVVMPGFAKLSPAPCGECQERMKTTRHAVGIGGIGAQNPSRGTRVYANTPRILTQNPAHGYGPSVREPIDHLSVAQARHEETASPLPSDSPSLSPEDSLQRVRSLIATITHRNRESPATVNSDPSSAETAGTHGTAQAPRHTEPGRGALTGADLSTAAGVVAERDAQLRRLAGGDLIEGDCPPEQDGPPPG
jgi:hypothetical protein